MAICSIIPGGLPSSWNIGTKPIVKIIGKDLKFPCSHTLILGRGRRLFLLQQYYLHQTLYINLTFPYNSSFLLQNVPAKLQSWPDYFPILLSLELSLCLGIVRVLFSQQNSSALLTNPWTPPATSHHLAFAHAVQSICIAFIFICWLFTHFQISVPLPPILWRPGGRGQREGRVWLSRCLGITVAWIWTKLRHIELSKEQNLQITSRFNWILTVVTVGPTWVGLKLWPLFQFLRGCF